MNTSKINMKRILKRCMSTEVKDIPHMLSGPQRQMIEKNAWSAQQRTMVDRIFYSDVSDLTHLHNAHLVFIRLPELKLRYDKT